MTRRARSKRVEQAEMMSLRREFGRFIRIALNSTSELEYHLIVARDIKAMDTSDINALAAQTTEVRRMLHGLLAKVNASVSPQAKGPG